MPWNPRSLVVLSLVAEASAATATPAQKAGKERPAVMGEFVQIGDTYWRASAISTVTIRDRQVLLGSDGPFDLNDCVALLRALGIPPVASPKPATEK